MKKIKKLFINKMNQKVYIVSFPITTILFFILYITNVVVTINRNDEIFTFDKNHFLTLFLLMLLFDLVELINNEFYKNKNK